jgi:hypothetical protein
MASVFLFFWTVRSRVKCGAVLVVSRHCDGDGYLVRRYGNYILPFVPMAALLAVGFGLWFSIDPMQSLIPQTLSES